MGKESASDQECFRRFQETCQRSFGNLFELYGFVFVTGYSNGKGDYIAYKNDTTGVEISAELYYPGVFVRISRLVHGAIPKPLIAVDDNTRINSFDLNDLIRLKGGTEVIGNASKPDQAIEAYANWLRQFGAEVLRGDFAVLPTIETTIRERAKTKRW